MEDKKVMEIPIENIVPNPYQPRKVLRRAVAVRSHRRDPRFHVARRSGSGMALYG